MPSETQNSRDSSVKMGTIGSRPYWVLNLSLLVRAAHQVGAAVFLAAFLLDAGSGPPMFYAIVAFLSGGLLVAAEWWRHPQLHREVAGMITIGKLAIVGAAYHGLLHPKAFVLLAFVVASVGAHAPKKVRHRLLF